MRLFRRLSIKDSWHGFYPQINVISDDSRKQFENSVDDALGKTTLILSKDESTAYAQAKGESDEGKTMGSVLPPLFCLSRF